MKNCDIFLIFAQNIDCGSMFLTRNMKNNVYPCKPQFYYIKVGFKGVRIIYACFRDELVSLHMHQCSLRSCIRPYHRLKQYLIFKVVRVGSLI